MSRTSERRARRATAQRKAQTTGLLQNRNLWLYGGLVLLLVIIVILAINILNRPQSPNAVSATPGALPTVVVGNEIAVPSMGANHIQPGQAHAPYNSTPPTSGPHYDTPAPWTNNPNTPLPEETWVHNLEHGGIVALYNCPQGCPDLVSRLETLRKVGPPSHFGYVKLIIAPYNKVPNRLTLVAWNYYLPLDDYDDAAVRKFILAHQDKGPEDAG